MAIWLQEEFTSAGIDSRIIGRSLCTSQAHVAVIAFDAGGREYFCDLGDQWLQPILISGEGSGFSPEYHSGFAPGLRVKVEFTGDRLIFAFAGQKGKEYTEQFDLTSVPADTLMRASDSQALLRRPFVEIRAIHPADGIRHLWEYDRSKCFWHLDSGFETDCDCDSPISRNERIHQVTGIPMPIIPTAFEVYRQHGIET